MSVEQRMSIAQIAKALAPKAAAAQPVPAE
jgi:hypothetical protein